MGFTETFNARVLPAAQRAFGVASEYQHGDNVIEVALYAGLHDSHVRNTLGQDFTHIRTKEFVVAASDLVIDGELFYPRAGDSIRWTDTQNAEQEWSVFPVFNDRSYTFLDLALSQLMVFAVSSADIETVEYKPPNGEAIPWQAILGREQYGDQWSDGSDDIKLIRRSATGSTDRLIEKGITGVQKMATVFTDYKSWSINMPGSSWSAGRAVIGLTRPEISRHEQMESHGTVR